MPPSQAYLFQRQLQAAFDRQRQEQEQSVQKLLDNIASLCQNSSCDGPSIACAFRSLQKGGDISIGSTGGDSSKSMFGTSGAVSTLPSSVVVSSVQDNPKSEDSGSALSSKPSKFTAMQDVDSKDLERMKTFAVEKCKFIDKDGKIKEPPTIWKRMLGRQCPGFLNWLERMTCGNSENQKKKSCCATLIETPGFKLASALAITLNFLFIIVQTDWKMSNLNAVAPVMHKVIDIMFTSYYTVEVTVTIIALGPQFFFGPDWTWNWFDLIIVGFSVLQEFLELMHIKLISTSFLRVLRFFKISKILRMFEAMRSFKEVKIMVDSLQGSFMVFTWCVIMLGLYLSVFGIFFVQGLTQRLEDESALPEPISASEKETIANDFGTVSKAMASLFMAVSGGNDWAAYHETVDKLGAVYSSLFFFFILFAMIAFFNVCTGVFCEKAMSLARPCPDEVFMRRQSEEVKEAKELKRMLKRIMNLDGAPELSIDQIDEFMKHPEVLAYYGLKGMNAASARRFFKVMAEINGADKLDFQTFVAACVQLDAQATGVDLMVINVELKAVQMSLHHVHEEINAVRKLQYAAGHPTWMHPRAETHEPPPPPSLLYHANPLTPKPYDNGIASPRTPMSSQSLCAPPAQLAPQPPSTPSRQMTTFHEV